MPSQKVRTFLLFFLLLLAASGCATAPARDETAAERVPDLSPVTLGAGEKLRVIATTSIVGDVVAQVGGDAIELETLIAPGQDPHAYQASASALASAANADVIFVNGFGLEEGLLDDLRQAARGVPIVPLSAAITPLEGSAHQHEHEEEEHEEEDEAHAGDADPHVWFDPDNVALWATTVADSLGRLDPERAPTFEAQRAAYASDLAALDAEIRDLLAPIPPERRRLVTNHDTFGYFGRAYDFEIVGAIIPNVSTSDEPSAADLSALVERVREAGVPALFVENVANSTLAAVVAEESGTRLYELYTDALGAPGSGADSYLGMMRANAATIAGALAP